MSRKIAVILLLLVLPAATPAETLVLLQGYLGDGDYWRESGITRMLARNGWADAGTLSFTPYGIRADRPPPKSHRRAYTVTLPSEAPLMMQHRYLEQYLDVIRNLYPHESLLLVGHSAGGVLGRLYMVTHPDKPVGVLITIASPHLGTESAEIGVMAGDSPLGWLAPLIGGSKLNRSQNLYYELVRERPGSLLFWLNRQERPSSIDVSIVRNDDLLMRTWGPDRNQVAVLSGGPREILTKGAAARYFAQIIISHYRARGSCNTALYTPNGSSGLVISPA
jgi:triacylglycerol lipase